MNEEFSGRIQVLALSDLTESVDMLETLLSQEPSVHVRASRMAFGEGVKTIARYEPQVVIITDTIDDPAAAVEELDTAMPGLPVLAILPEGDFKGAQECTLAGARGTLFKPFDQQLLIGAIQQLHAKEMRRRLHLTTSLEAGPIRPQRPRIIAVHGVKGGVGTTTIACNLAASLHKLTSRRVVLFDGDLLCGDAGVMTDVSSNKTLADLLPAVRELDADFLDTLLAKHASGFRVLLAPEQLQRAESIRGEDMQRALAGIKPYFDFTVVDTTSLLTPVTLATLDEADMIVLVVTPEIVALRNAARFVQLTNQLGYPTDKLLVVVNRANAGKGISPAVIEQQLQRKVAVAIPSDGRALVEAMNVGELIVESRSNHKVSKSVGELATGIATFFGWDPSLEKGAAASTAPKRAVAIGPASPADGAGTAPPPKAGGRGSIFQRFRRQKPAAIETAPAATNGAARVPTNGAAASPREMRAAATTTGSR